MRFRVTNIRPGYCEVWANERVGGEFPVVVGICAYDGDRPYGPENLPSINIEEA